jgi:Cd2+/Zn2+-exporting ATPase
MVIKVIVLILGAGGMATLWEAVIAEVGVALFVILNAVSYSDLYLFAIILPIGKSFTWILQKF